MPLSKSQYDSIIKTYDKIRDRNRQISEERLALIYQSLPDFRSLDESVAALSVSVTAAVIDGEQGALNRLHNSLKEIALQKKQLLATAGYPADFLDPIYDCPDCQDTGFLPAKQGLRKKCHCFRNREIEILYDQSNIREMIATENFSTLSFDYYEGEDRKRFERAVEICHNFVRNFKKDYQNIFLYGTVGTGKSFLSGCVANELLREGHSVIYFSSSQLFDTLARYSFDRNAKESLQHFYDDLYHCDLIIIDDLGTELTNAFVATQLFSCLNERQLRKKSTIISSNLGLESLRDLYSDRVFSRITSNYQLCKLSGPDVRMLKKCNRNSL